MTRRCADVALVAACILLVALGVSLGPPREAALAGGAYVLWSGVVLWLRRARPPVGAVGTFLTGLLALAIGLGAGLEPFRSVGPSPSSVVGLAMVVVALVLVASGLADLGFSLGGRSGVFGVVIAGLVAWFLVVPLLVDPVADALLLTFPPAFLLGDRTPADMGVGYDVVSLRSSDGVALSGWYTPSQNGAAVVLLHGVAATRSDLVEHAAVLAENGFGVLLLDPRGYADSGGRAMDLGWYGERDLEGAVDFLADQPDVDADRIGLVGLSLGGEASIGAAAADPRVRAVVAEGASYRVLDDQPPRIAEGWMGRAADWVMFRTVDALTGAPAPLSLVESVARIAPRPVLLITGADPREEEAAREMMGSAPESVEVWRLPDTPHVGGLATHPGEWEERVVAFLDGALLATDAVGPAG